MQTESRFSAISAWAQVPVGLNTRPLEMIWLFFSCCHLLLPSLSICFHLFNPLLITAFMEKAVVHVCVPATIFNGQLPASVLEEV